MSRTTILTAMLAALVLALVPSCTHEPYQTGDGSLSYLRADYADITIAGSAVTDIFTDDDTHLLPPPDLAVSPELPPDTMLRRLIHYNLTSATAPIEILQFTPVTILLPVEKAEMAEAKTDPLTLTAAWLSANRRYLNLHLGVMVGGDTDAMPRQQLAVTRDSIHTGGKGAVFLTLRHDQAGVPQYYTQDLHVSLPLNSLVATATPFDTVSITVPTYSGIVTKVFTK